MVKRRPDIQWRTLEASERCAAQGTQRTELILVEFEEATFAVVSGADGRRTLEGTNLESPTAALFYDG